jgi:hypothetical protein
VCNTCWCKTLRTKHARCPLLSCSTSSKVKKLRHLPGKWAELSAHTRDVLSAELRKFLLVVPIHKVFITYFFLVVLPWVFMAYFCSSCTYLGFRGAVIFSSYRYFSSSYFRHTFLLVVPAVLQLFSAYFCYSCISLLVVLGVS